MRVEEREAQRRAEREAHVVAADAASAELVDDDYLRARVVYFAVFSKNRLAPSWARASLAGRIGQVL